MRQVLPLWRQCVAPTSTTTTSQRLAPACASCRRGAAQINCQSIMTQTHWPPTSAGGLWRAHAPREVAVTAGLQGLQTAVAAFQGKLTPGSEGEVAAVAGLRGVLVSLGPFYIKLGQALSIRPDILSPQAMVQLQQLCDKVPPLTRRLPSRRSATSWASPMSLRSTRDHARAGGGRLARAGSQGDARDGAEVAVKVQRPFVLETVSLDLHLTRLAGLALRAINPDGAKAVDIVFCSTSSLRTSIRSSTTSSVRQRHPPRGGDACSPAREDPAQLPERHVSPRAHGRVGRGREALAVHRR